MNNIIILIGEAIRHLIYNCKFKGISKKVALVDPQQVLQDLEARYKI